MTTILIKKKDTAGAPAAGDLTNAAGGAEIAVNTATKRIYTKDSGGTVVEVGTNPTATTMNGNLTFAPDATYDIGASGATRPRDVFMSRNLTVGGTMTVAGGINFNGNVTVGDSSADTLTINSTITSNLIFTDNTYDIGASGATRPRNLYLSSALNIANSGTGTLMTVSSAGAWSSGYYDIANLFVTNITGGAVSFNVGKAGATNNAGKIAFNYAGGSGSTSNYLELGFFNNDGLFRVYGTGNISNVRSNAAVYSGSNSATWVNGLALTNNATAATGVANLINFGGTSNVNAVYGVVQNASGYGDFVWAGYNGSFTELGRFTSAGNFGIGTSSPSYLLDVNGTFRSSVTGGSMYTTSAGGIPRLYIGGGNGFGFNRQSAGEDVFFGEPADTGTFRVRGAGTISLGVGNSATTMTVVGNGGNVGIGNTSPTGKLDVTGRTYIRASGSDTALTFVNQSGGDGSITVTGTSTTMNYVFNTYSTANALFIANAGNVGIGTASPAFRLDVYRGSSGVVLNLQGVDAYSAETAISMATQRAKISAFLSPTGGFPGADLRFSTTPDSGSMTERVRITRDGAFCVGTTDTFSNAGIVLDVGSAGTNRPIAVHGTGGVDGTYVDWLVSAPYGSNTTEINIIKSSISSNAGSSGLQFFVSDGGGASTTTRSFQINRTSCTVVGSLSKGSGSFKIDHPLPEKTDTHHLVHSFIEGPQADLIYRGKVNLVDGKANVNIDTAAGMTEGTFVVLCRDVQCFTTNESDWTAVRGSVSGNTLTIEAQDQTCTANISWMVIGERQDKHMYDTDWTDDDGKVIVEPLKS